MILYDDIADFAQQIHQQHKSVGLATGCYDVLHPGHLFLLESAKRHSDILVVGINSDASVRRLKGESRPVLPAYERAQMLSALRLVDHVAIFDDDDPCRLIERLRPDLFFKGADWCGRPMPEGDVIERQGGQVVFVPLYRQYSTTRLLGAIDQ